MERLGLSPQEQETARERTENDRWMEQEEFREDPEYLACVQDILDHPVFQSMDGYFQHGKTTCREHCLRVSYHSYRICRKHGWDYYETARAALLHDLFLYDWHTHAKETGEYFHGFTHPRVAMKNAIRYFGISEMQQNLILRHMWPLTPIPPKYKEGYAIIYADKFCGLEEVAGRMRDWFIYNLRPSWARR